MQSLRIPRHGNDVFAGSIEIKRPTNNAVIEKFTFLIGALSEKL